MQEKEHVYSYHTFIFPFMWEMNDDFQKNYNEFVKYFEKNDKWEDTNWEDSVTIPKMYRYRNSELYKEYQYFHPYVRKSIYGYDGNVVRNFCLKPEEKFTYKIVRENIGSYELDIKSVQLKIYNTGVALFILDCENYQNRSLSDVKNINDWGRRIYAPYIPSEGDGATASTLIISASGDEICTQDYQTFYEEQRDLDMYCPCPDCEKRERLPLDSSCLFLRKILEYGQTEKKFVSMPSKGENEIYTYPAMDDRMFVMCAVADEDATKGMLNKVLKKYAFERDANIQKSLYELAYIDGSGMCTCQNEEMREEYIDKCIYRRWLDWDSIYTVTYQAVIMLSSAGVNSSEAHLYQTFRTEYFQMLCLCLAQRASIIKFNQMVENYSSRVACEGNTATLKSELTDIQNRFLAFQGQLCFDEISSEEQAIELYGMMKERLFIDEELSVTKERVSALYEAANTSSGNELNAVATVFALVSVAISILAIVYDKLNVSDVVYVEGIETWKKVITILIIVLCLVISIGGLIFAKRFSRKRVKGEKTNKFLGRKK